MPHRQIPLVPGPWSLVPGPWSLVPGPWSLRDPADDGGAEPAGQGDGQALPEADQGPIAGVVGPQVGGGAGADVILPGRGLGVGAPLGLEAIGRAVGAGPAEVEGGLAARDGAFQEVPVHQHGGAGGVVAPQRAGAG